MEQANVDDDGSPPGEEASSDFSSSLELKKWTDEAERYREITEYIRQVDEILDFIKPFPRDRCPDSGNALVRLTSSSSQTDNSDHLENLIKLVEQLKDLKEKDSKINERTQYLKDLKRLRERKKLLKYEAELGACCWGDDKHEESDSQARRVRSSLPFRKINRGRSKSMNMDEIAKERDVRLRRGRFRSDEEQRRTSGGSLKSEKSKVSKWTKVKEAFRWEKASVESKANKREDVQYLQVPQDKTPESLSDSPVSGQVSGSSSVGAPSTICLAVSSGYSGEHSSEGHSTSSGYGIDLPPPPPPLPSEDDFLSLPLIQDLSSSSSSEKLDELLTYSESLTKGNFRDDIIAGSFNVAFHDDRQTDDIEARRSKSLDGDAVLGPSPSLVQHLSKESLKFSKSLKTHKTAWGKVKDIIQTRKDSLKKKPKKRNSEKCGEAFMMQSGLDQERQDDPYCMENKPKEILNACPKTRIELAAESSEDTITSTSSNKLNVTDSVSKRRLTPVLTITVPSTEELRSISSAETDIMAAQKSNPPFVSDGKDQINAENFEYFENIPKYEKNKSGSYHRFSKWSKVKRAFLTSPARSPDFAPEAGSSPSSPNKLMTFFSDIESDELSSGEWTEDKIHIQDKSVNVEAESPGIANQEDIQKRYLEHHHKLGHEFDQKLRQWERIKAAETKAKHERLLKKQKSEDWDKIPQSGMRQRESMAIPLPKLDDLSPEFKKKLDEWKKIKKSPTIPTVLNTPPKDETQSQNFKMRIGEWQKWRPRSSQKLTKNEPNEEFAKKLEEWQRIKGTIRRSRSQSDRGKDENEHQTPSPRLRRKNSKSAFKKASSSGKSSGTESLSGSLKEKDGRSGSRKQQKEKDLQWLEKELHKIEREKLRLEREKEKFLEREARLEKMKRTISTTSPTQEILIKTPTGFFRFEGISQKFTKKLYEWEKARGIAPEASTFALLEECVRRTAMGIREDNRSVGMSLQRSKSMGSVLEISSAIQDLPHHPSSLSLNDMDELDVLNDTQVLEELRESSEPMLLGIDRDDEPLAIIVDVEDVVEETAALMTDVPLAKCETPVYTCAPTEATQLISSCCSDKVKIQIIEQAGDQTNSNTPDRNNSTVPKIKSETCRSNEHDSGCNVLEKNQCNVESGNLKYSCEENNNIVTKHMDTSTINQQQAVSRVHELSSQLLCLAEKLEVALNERNDDKKQQNLLYNRRRQMNCLKTGEMRLACAKGDLSENKNQSTNLMQQDLSQLPGLITNKVLELKSGLNILKSATESPTAETSSFETANKKNLPVTVKEEQNENSALKICISSGLSFENEANRVKSQNLEEIGTVEKEPSICLERSKIQTLFGESVAFEYENHREAASKNNSPELIKKKVKEKISLMQRMTTEGRQRNFKPFQFNHRVFEENTDEEILEMTAGEDSDKVDEKVVVVRKNGKVNKQRKLLKTRRITDTTIAYNQVVEGNKTPSEKEYNDEVFIVPKTKGLVQEQVVTAAKSTVGKAPVNVFVPTTRKIISPIRRDSKGTTSSILSYVIDDISPRDEKNKSIVPGETDRTPKASTSPEILRKMDLLRVVSERSNEKKDIGIPPLPNSPIQPRKSALKETAPSIRIMIAKYNQKIEQGTSSEASASSQALWRSPVFERRFPDQDVLKNVGKFGRLEVQKSASTGLIRSEEESKASIDPPTGILKSSSSELMKITMEASASEEKEAKPATASTLRAFRIKKAKEEFLSRGPGGQSWTSEASSPTFEVSLRDSNMLSHVSAGSESSCDDTFDSNLIKSASAGTINMEDSSRRSSEGQDERNEEALSQKATGKPSWRSGICSIKSRFRKVRMKKAKEHDNSKMATISTLCRQSLLLEIPNGMDHLTSSVTCTSKSCPSSPVLERNTNWLGSSTGRIFKAKPDAS